MKLNFATLDVFTTKRFAGNSLGVVFDADGIDGATMQVIAREFNHPETVFVLKPKAAGSTAGARIFTPGREMPFAGHPTVGTALVLTLPPTFTQPYIWMWFSFSALPRPVLASATSKGLSTEDGRLTPRAVAPP